jgi:hypothetical protein
MVHNPKTSGKGVIVGLCICVIERKDTNTIQHQEFSCSRCKHRLRGGEVHPLDDEICVLFSQRNRTHCLREPGTRNTPLGIYSMLADLRISIKAYGSAHAPAMALGCRPLFEAHRKHRIKPVLLVHETMRRLPQSSLHACSSTHMGQDHP